MKDFRRLLFLAFFILILFSLLIYRYFTLQLIESDKWTKVANRQHYFVVQEPFQRGRFFSNTGIKKGHPEIEQALVFDVQKFHLHIDPDTIPSENKKEVLNQLIRILKLEKVDKEFIEKQLNIKSRDRKLLMWLDKESRDAVLNWWVSFAKKNKIPKNALFFVNDYKRSYPFGKLLGQVLHTVQNQRDELTKQALPTGGLELSLDSYLKGRTGKRRLMRSPRNAFETGEVIISPQNGADVYLTINHCLQAICEEELENGVKKAQAKGGSVVMMDPFTGEVLAFAQYPFFYPPDYQTYFNDKELIEHTKLKAITDTIEPGSTFKPISIGIALKANDELIKRGENKIFDPDAKMPCDNSHFKGRGKPLVDTHLHRFLNMKMAIQKSSNIYPARLLEKVADRLGPQYIRDQLIHTFGFGLKTNLELPAESAGVVPTPLKKHPNGKDEWSISTPVSLAFGHNIQVTSIQMLRAYAILVNGGYFIEPTLIKKIVRKNDKGELEVLVDNSKRSFLSERIFPEKFCKLLVNCLKYSTKFGGTARKADVPGYTEGGKTSTAKKIVNGKYSETAYVPSFLGFTPASKPEFIMMVTLDEPHFGFVPGEGLLHHGGACCAPIFAKIAKRSLDYLGITPDDPFGYAAGDPRRDADKADWMKEIRELKDLYEKWNIH